MAGGQGCGTYALSNVVDMHFHIALQACRGPCCQVLQSVSYHDAAAASEHDRQGCMYNIMQKSSNALPAVEVTPVTLIACGLAGTVLVRVLMGAPFVDTFLLCLSNGQVKGRTYNHANQLCLVHVARSIICGQLGTLHLNILFEKQLLYLTAEADAHTVRRTAKFVANQRY